MLPTVIATVSLFLCSLSEEPPKPDPFDPLPVVCTGPILLEELPEPGLTELLGLLVLDGDANVVCEGVDCGIKEPTIAFWVRSKTERETGAPPFCAYP